MLNKSIKQLTIVDDNGKPIGFGFNLDDLTQKLFVTLDDNKPFKDTMRIDVDISVERKTPLFLITMSNRDEKLFNELLENNQKFKETIDYFASDVAGRVREKGLTKFSYSSYEQTVEINRSLNKIFDLSK
jgi:patatin-like phospholipase/acyl hydrolase